MLPLSITPSFHSDILAKYFTSFVSNSRSLMTVMDTLCEKGQPFHVYSVMTHVALDIITECASGESVGALRDGSSQYVRSVYEQLSSVFERMLKPWFWPDALYWTFTSSGRRSARALRVLHGHTRRLIER
jgi:hypothetical protein